MIRPMRRSFVSLLALTLSVLAVAPAAAQGRLGAKADARLTSRVADGVVRAAIEVRIEPGWHLYHDDLGNPEAIGKPTRVEMSGAGITWSEVRFPKPLKLDQPGLGTWIYGHEGTIVLYAAGRIEEGAGGEDIGAELDGLTCEDLGLCIPYGQELTSKGAGKDALFASFPQDLVLSLTKTATVPDVQAAKVPLVAKKDSGKASARLFSRVKDGRVRVAIPIDIEEGWHLYHTELGPPEATGLPTTVTLLGAGVEWSAVRFPAPLRLDQPGLDTWIYAHEGKIVLHAEGVLPGGNAVPVGVLLEGLTCEDAGTCIPYKELAVGAGRGDDKYFADFPDDLVIGSSGGEFGSESPGASGGIEPNLGTSAAAGSIDYAAVTFPDFEPQTETATHSLVMWLLIAFLAGMILNVMPCVLPVISIKILSFVQQAGEDKRRILALGLAFAAGIVVVFLGLATVAVSLQFGWGEQFQSQTFLVVMIGIVFAFALSLFGVYELGAPLPAGAASSMSKEGLPDAFFKGMLATVLATPCSGPFLGSTLTWTLAQPSLTVFAIFLALGLGMALPYVILTANPRLLRILPKPGPWMDTFKQVMGFVLLATVIYLMISLRQDLLLFTATFLVFVAIGCWWWGRFATFDQSVAKRYATLVFAVLIVAGGARISFADFRGLFAVEAAGPAGETWEDFDGERLVRLLESGRSVFVDFTADWCPNCKWNEKFVYDDDEVRELFVAKQVIRMKADITHDSPETDVIERLMVGLGAHSIPFMALFPSDRPFEPHVRWDIVRTNDMSGLLETLP